MPAYAPLASALQAPQANIQPACQQQFERDQQALEAQQQRARQRLEVDWQKAREGLEQRRQWEEKQQPQAGGSAQQTRRPYESKSDQQRREFYEAQQNALEYAAEQEQALRQYGPTQQERIQYQNQEADRRWAAYRQQHRATQELHDIMVRQRAQMEVNRVGGASAFTDVDDNYLQTLPPIYRQLTGEGK